MYTLTLALFFLVAAPGLASITCVKAGVTATARWINAEQQSCMWTGTVGSNFGIDGVNGGKYVRPKSEGKRGNGVDDYLVIVAMAGKKKRTHIGGTRLTLKPFRCGAGCTGSAIGNV